MVKPLQPQQTADHEIRSTTGAEPYQSNATEDLALAPDTPSIPVLTTTSARAILTTPNTRHRPPPLTLHNNYQHTILPPYLKTANPGCGHDYYYQHRHLTPESTKSSPSPLIVNVHGLLFTENNVNLNDPALLSTATTKVSNYFTQLLLHWLVAGQSFQILHIPVHLPRCLVLHSSETIMPWEL